MMAEVRKEIDPEKLFNNFVKYFTGNFNSPPGATGSYVAVWSTFTNTLIGRVPNFSHGWYAGLIRNIVYGLAGSAVGSHRDAKYNEKVGVYVSASVTVLLTLTPFTVPWAVVGILTSLVAGALTSALLDESSKVEVNINKPKPFPATHARRHDPLVLDLNGDGVKLTSLDGSKVNFDFGGDGFAEKTGWVSAQDGLLTLDKNNNGKIDNGSELFASAREDGFTALSHYDLNQDGKINSSDAVFAKLRVWRDANGNGVTDKGELLTLAQAGVKEISLEKKASGIDNAGDRIDFTGSFTRTNGKSGDSVAVSFSINQTLTKWKPPAGFKVSAEAGKLPVHFVIAA